MEKMFVAGYISLAEGEKDPRNLLVAFAIARVILIEFDISDYTEVRVLHVSVIHLIQSTITSHYSISRFVIFQSHFVHRQMIHMALLRMICVWH
jgi:Dos2-interacting transcription regulator of RNA-Pol-II